MSEKTVKACDVFPERTKGVRPFTIQVHDLEEPCDVAGEQVFEWEGDLSPGAYTRLIKAIETALKITEEKGE